VLICRTRIKEYLPIVGLVEFNKLSAKLILGADRYAFSVYSLCFHHFVFSLDNSL